MLSCPTCGDKFDTERGKKIHHSSVHGKSLIPEYECFYCGNSFRRSENRGSGEKNYCSRECMSADREDKIEVECGECGSALHLKRHRVEERGHENFFCDVNCQAEFKSNGRVDWHDSAKAKEVRNKVYERDDYICQDCGGEGTLNAHHIERRYERPDLVDDIDNLVTLCVECHAKRHEEAGEEDAARLLRAKYDLAGVNLS